MKTRFHCSRFLAGLVLLAATGGAAVAEIAEIFIKSGDEQALIDAIREANRTNTPLLIIVTSGEPFVFHTVENNVMGPSFLPPIETRVSIISTTSFSSSLSRTTVQFKRAKDAPAGRFFFVAATGSLSLTDVDFENGMAPDDGGAIKSQGTLSLVNCAFENNTAGGDGGGVLSEGELNLNNCVFRNNSADGDGAGLSVRSSTSIENTILADNTAGGFGGAVDCKGPGDVTLSLLNVIVDSNIGQQGAGGVHADDCAVIINNSNVTRNQNDGIWVTENALIFNSALGGNTPNNCQVFGPPTNLNFTWVSNSTCGPGGNGNRIDARLDALFTSLAWDELIDGVDPPLLFPPPLPPEYRELLDSIGMTGTGSPEVPGTFPTACLPIGFNGAPVVPPDALCTPGAIQFEIPGEVPVNISNLLYDPNLRGFGYSLQDLGNRRYRLDHMVYDSTGNQAWHSALGFNSGPFLVFPGAEFFFQSGGAAADLRIGGPDGPISCGTDEPTQLSLWNQDTLRFPNQLQSRTLHELKIVGLAEIIPAAEFCNPFHKAIQDGHSGGFVSEDRPLDRVTLFILTRGEAVVYWLTADDNGAPAWYFGVGQFDGDSVVFDDMYVTSGPTFPDGYDPDDLNVERAGSAVIAFADCDNATLDHDIAASGGPDSVAFERDASLAGTSCVDG